MEEIAAEWGAMRRRLQDQLDAQDRFVQMLLERPQYKTPTLEPEPTTLTEEKFLRLLGQCNGASGAAGSGKCLEVVDVPQEPYSQPGIDEDAGEMSQNVTSRSSWGSWSSHRLHGQASGLADIRAWRAGKQPLNLRGLIVKCCESWVHWWNLLQEPARTGRLAQFVMCQAFESTTIFMVILNCALVIHQNNVNIESPESMSKTGVLAYMDIAFTAYFLCELVLRLTVHRLYFFVNTEMYWNILDFAIVASSFWMILESYFIGSAAVQLTFLRSFRILKLCRVLRLLKLIKVFADLRIMVTAFLNSCIALFWCVVLLLFTISMFALVLVQVIGDYLLVHAGEACDSVDGPCLNEELKAHFGSVHVSMLSLYMSTTGGNDWGYYYDMVSQASGVAGVLFVSYTAFYYYGVFNLVTGMFVDKALRAAKPDDNLLVLEQRSQDHELTAALTSLLKELGMSSDGLVSKEEFRRLMSSEGGCKYLKRLGLDAKDSRVVFELLSEASDQVRVSDFVTGCLRLQEGAASLDLHALQLELRLMRRGLAAALQRPGGDGGQRLSVRAPGRRSDIVEV